MLCVMVAVFQKWRQSCKIAMMSTHKYTQGAPAQCRRYDRPVYAEQVYRAVLRGMTHQDGVDGAHAVVVVFLA